MLEDRNAKHQMEISTLEEQWGAKHKQEVFKLEKECERLKSQCVVKEAENESQLDFIKVLKKDKVKLEGQLHALGEDCSNEREACRKAVHKARKLMEILHKHGMDPPSEFSDHWRRSASAHGVV